MAPFKLALEDDNVGLQVGESSAKIKKILVTLDVTADVVGEAVKNKADLIISHHPLIYQRILNITDGDPVGKNILKLSANKISLIVAHTNLDRADDGVNDTLADKLDLKDVRLLEKASDAITYKVAVFVPEANVEDVSRKVALAGAGIIGDYTHCAFRTKGHGTFKPGKKAQPYSGIKGELNVIDEVKLEFTVRSDRLQNVLDAMVKVHPYEEVAYDIYQLKNKADYGFGRVGELSKPVTLKEFVKTVEKKLKAANLRHLGNPNKKVSKVAVCGGSGSALIDKARRAGTDVFVTGDIKYHDAIYAQEQGFAIIDAGHGVTERVVIPKFVKNLKKELSDGKAEVTVLASQTNTEPWSK